MTDTTQQVDGLTRAVANLDSKLNAVLPKLSTLLSGGSGGGVGSSMGGMSPGSMLASNLVGGVGNVVSGIASGMAAAMPGVAATQTYNMGYYQGSIFAPGYNKQTMMKASFSAMAGGITSPGADSMVSNYFMGRGVNFSTASNSTYMQLMRSTSNAAKYLGMDNQSAATALENLTSGQTSANLMQSLGTYTSDPMTGKSLTQSQIFGQIANQVFSGNSGNLNVTNLMDSYRRGNLGADLNNLGLSQDQQTMFMSYMVNKLGGKTMDLSNNAAMKSIMGANNAKGNTNPLASALSINTTMTDQMGAASGVYEQGANQAAAWFSSLNGVIKDTITQFGQLNAQLQTAAGTPAGQAVQKGAPALTGAMTLGGAVLGGIVGTFIEPGAGTIAGAALGSNIGNALGSLIPKGGSSGGNGTGAFSGGGTGSSPSASAVPANGPITARWHEMGPMWGAQGHNGVDYGVRDGSPVYAAADGVVSTDSVGSGAYSFGHYVTVDHGNGYKTIYAHLDPSSADVQPGQKVTAGQRIGTSGHSGHVTGPHLHFEVTKDGTPVDPSVILTGAAQIDPSKAGNGKYSTSSTNDAGGFSGATLSASVNDLLGISAPTTSASVPAWTGSSSPGRSYSLGTSASTAATGVGGSYSGMSLGGITPAGGGSVMGGGTKVDINLTIAQASEAEARKFAETVKQILDEHAMTSSMGSR